MTTELIVEKSVCAYNADRFYIANYKGDMYLTMFFNGNLELCTKSELTKESYFDGDCFCTPVKIDDLENLFCAKMFVTHKGNEYEVINVRPEMKSVVIQARKGMEVEDLQLGFREDIKDNFTWKVISREEIEDVRIERTSVYDEVLQKYGGK